MDSNPSNQPDNGTEFSGGDFDDAYPPGYEHHYWHRARSAIVKRYVQAFCCSRDTLLEIGAGRGHYVRVLRDAGFEAYGCDLGQPFVSGDVRSFYFENTDFVDLDVNLRDRVQGVLLLDVLEHIEEPQDFLERILRTFPLLRTLIITVPARQELWSNYDEHYRHFLRYDAGKLCDLAKRSGLAVRDYRYFFHGLYVPAWLLKKLGVDRQTTFSAPRLRWLHRLLGAAFQVESRILPNRVYGTSLICACNRWSGS